MRLVTRPARRRNETRDLLRPIMLALNDLPGVRVWRPHTLNSSLGMVTGAGLAEGSSDLVGICTVPIAVPVGGGCRPARGPDGRYVLGRWLSLEVKWPGEKPTADQLRWGKCVHDLGGFWCVVHSVAEALSAVERCRKGLAS
jgi:hypothetical protein